MDTLAKQRLQRFVDEADESPSHLAFILDNLGSRLLTQLDAESLGQAQTAYLRIKDTEDSIESEWRENLLYVLPLYIGEMIVHATDAEWVPETRKSRLHQGPYRVTGFGDMEWETYYPAVARRLIESDGQKITSIFAEAIRVWDLRCRILSRVQAFFATSKGCHSIADIMAILVDADIAPEARFGPARYKQFQKRVAALMKTDARFRRIPKTKDVFELRS